MYRINGHPLSACLLTVRYEICLQVSWIRQRDLHVLTSAIVSYTSDGRFSVQHNSASDDWELHISSTQTRDAGYYECQVNTEPKLHWPIYLQVHCKSLCCLVFACFPSAVDEKGQIHGSGGPLPFYFLAPKIQFASSQMHGQEKLSVMSHTQGNLVEAGNPIQRTSINCHSLLCQLSTLSWRQLERRTKNHICSHQKSVTWPLSISNPTPATISQ